MTQINLLRAAAVAIVASVCIASSSGCSAAPISAARLDSLETLLAACPPNSNAAVNVRVDESGSRYSPHLVGEERNAVLDALTRAAVCGHGVGRFRLDLFSASIASAANVVDVELDLPGATDIARLRQAPALIAKTTKTIDRDFADAAETLTDGGTDIPAQLVAASQFLAQANSATASGQRRYALDLVILTDGESNAGNSYVPTTATSNDAAALAKSESVPILKGASILVAGVGETATGPRPSSAYVAALTEFLQVLCRRTNATKVTVVTDYSASGR